MALVDIQALVVDASGRQDLSTPSGETTLITYINAAQLFLDLKTWNFKKTKAIEVIALSAGQYFVSFKYARAIDQVSVSDSVSTTNVDLNTYTRSELRLQKYGQNPTNILSSDGTIAITSGGVVTGISTTIIRTLSDAGTVAIDGAGNVTGTLTTISADGAVVGDIMYLATTPALTLKIGSITSDTAWTVLDSDGSAYSGGSIGGGKSYYIITDGGNGVTSGSIMFVPNVGTGGIWLQVDTITSSTSWTVLNKDGTAYSGGTITAGEAFYIISEGSITWGRPVFAAENIIRIAPGTSVPLPALDTMDLISKAGSEAVISGLLLFPPPDADYTLRVEGYFLTQPLDAVTNTISYWTEHAGGIPLVSMTLKLLEGIQMRNITGAKGYAEITDDFLLDTRKEFIAQRSYSLGSKLRRD